MQLTLGAPVLMKAPAGMIDPVKLAMIEYENDMIPITVNREGTA